MILAVLGTLFITEAFAQADPDPVPPCPSPPLHAIVDNKCICTNAAATDCGSADFKKFSKILCGCECTSPIPSANCPKTGQVFSQNTCLCQCAGKDTTTCKSGFVYNDDTCRCVCPTTCACAAALDEETCLCDKDKKNKCKDVTFNCVTGALEPPANPNPECEIYDFKKCKFVPKGDCKGHNKKYKKIMTSAVASTCGCVDEVNDCAVYVPNPDFDPTKHGSDEFICKSCQFDKFYKVKPCKGCKNCAYWGIKVFDGTTDLGHLVLSEDNSKPENPVTLTLVPEITKDIKKKLLHHFKVDDQKSVCPTCFSIKTRVCSPGKDLFFSNKASDVLALELKSKQVLGKHEINHGLTWNIATDLFNSQADVFKARLNNKDKTKTADKDLNLVDAADVPDGQYDYQFTCESD